jgi:hypothetical protein
MVWFSSAILDGLIDHLLEREADGRGIESFLSRVCISEDGKRDVVGGIMVLILLKHSISIAHC